MCRVWESQNKLKTLNKLKSEFNKVFVNELGCCTKTEVRFKLKDNVKPVFKPKRKVPFSSLGMIDKELRRLEETGVIKKSRLLRMGITYSLHEKEKQ